ncbi:hypothetical protein Leryth_019755 [Lithospermum erythrorhizon]|uniref:Protein DETOXIFICATION n=1 Tax=Lithospermum erythrorhizon TaxID=34254 RepID=A0AAV3RDN1_LITER|nr:hypothetical protein Leryth_019755 [Lithospermum erythrorhizon]
MEQANLPLLTNTQDESINNISDKSSINQPMTAISKNFTLDGEDMEPITSMSDFFKNFYIESLMLWYLAGPAIFTILCQYSMGAITQVLAGHVGTLELASISLENSVIGGFAFGVMLGMGSALETLCGQAYGAGQINMLGIYIQRSWIILISSAIPIMFLYIFAASILRFIGQTPDISRYAGKFAIWMIPQLFAYALNFPIMKFLQAQSKIMVMAVVSGVALLLHVIFSWLLMIKLGWGMAGAAAVLNLSWWFLVVVQLLYILYSGSFGEAWTGFSWRAFENLWGFVSLSLSSAAMLCLENWYYTALVLFAGYLKNAEVAVGAFSICFNIVGWVIALAFGLNAAISVRVSNELGAGHPKKTKFSVVVVTLSSLLFGFFIALFFMITRDQFPAFFAESKEVQDLVYDLTPLLCISIIVNVLQPTLSGVAVGAGWQAYVAYVNIVCYYILGLPLGLFLGFVLDMDVKGIWYGMLFGTTTQTFVLIWMLYKTNWNQEASIAGDRIKHWGGETSTSTITNMS